MRECVELENKFFFKMVIKNWNWIYGNIIFVVSKGIVYIEIIENVKLV